MTVLCFVCDKRESQGQWEGQTGKSEWTLFVKQEHTNQMIFFPSFIYHQNPCLINEILLGPASRAPLADQERNLHLPCSPNYSNLLTPLRCGDAGWFKQRPASVLQLSFTSFVPFCCLSRGQAVPPWTRSTVIPAVSKTPLAALSAVECLPGLRRTLESGACWPGGKRAARCACNQMAEATVQLQ